MNKKGRANQALPTVKEWREIARAMKPKALQGDPQAALFLWYFGRNTEKAQGSRETR